MSIFATVVENAFDGNASFFPDALLVSCLITLQNKNLCEQVRHIDLWAVVRALLSSFQPKKVRKGLAFLEVNFSL